MGERDLDRHRRPGIARGREPKRVRRGHHGVVEDRLGRRANLDVLNDPRRVDEQLDRHDDGDGLRRRAGRIGDVRFGERTWRLEARRGVAGGRVGAWCGVDHIARAGRVGRAGVGA